ncbi:MAG: TA system VapC family ribonuclease toxin [Acidimicrobiales bacterium]
MSRALLDINVLLALLDSDHVDHLLAREWLEHDIGTGWASCAITQNGVVRIMSQPRYPSPVAPAVVTGLLEEACATPHHEFWPCEISLLDPQLVDRRRLHGPRQVTDAYLLALAVRKGGRFVTFDRSVVTSAVPGATSESLTVL